MNEYLIKSLFIISIVIIGIIILRYVLDKLGLWLESKGWLYYKKKPPSHGMVGSALLNIDAVFNPGARFVIETKKNIKINSIKKEQETSNEGILIETSNNSERQFEIILPNNLIQNYKNITD